MCAQMSLPFSDPKVRDGELCECALQQNGSKAIMWVPAIMTMSGVECARVDGWTKTYAVRLPVATPLTASSLWNDEKWASSVYRLFRDATTMKTLIYQHEQSWRSALRSTMTNIDSIIDKCGGEPAQIALIAAKAANLHLASYIILSRNVSIVAPEQAKVTGEAKVTLHNMAQLALQTVTTTLIFSNQDEDLVAIDFCIIAELPDRGAAISNPRPVFMPGTSVKSIMHQLVHSCCNHCVPDKEQDRRFRWRRNSRKTLLTAMLESGVRFLRDDSISCCPSSVNIWQESRALELEAHVHEEIDRLRAIKCHLLINVRGRLFNAHICDVICAYLPWWNSIELTLTQHDLLNAVQESRRDQQRHQEQIERLEQQNAQQHEQIAQLQTLVNQLFSLVEGLNVR